MKIKLFFMSFILFPLLVFSRSNDTIVISKEISLVKISNSIYIHISEAIFPQFGRILSNGLVYVNKGEAFLLDTPVTDELTKKLVEFLEDSMKLIIIGFIPNHWHNDCMGGLAYLQSKNIESFANQLTIDIAKEQNLPIPKNGFKDSLIISFDDKNICCYFLGAAHSLDNIVVWFPKEKVLFAGCMVKSISTNNLGNTKDGDVYEYNTTLKKVLSKFNQAKIVVPGHGAIGGTELIKHSIKLVKKNH